MPYFVLLLKIYSNITFCILFLFGVFFSLSFWKCLCTFVVAHAVVIKLLLYTVKVFLGSCHFSTNRWTVLQFKRFPDQQVSISKSTFIEPLQDCFSRFSRSALPAPAFLCSSGESFRTFQPTAIKNAGAL